MLGRPHEPPFSNEKWAINGGERWTTSGEQVLIGSCVLEIWEQFNIGSTVELTAFQRHIWNIGFDELAEC